MQVLIFLWVLLALNNGKLNTLEGCSTISDKDGKLLFYSDGITVWNKKHQVMKYSDGRLADDLKGNSSSTQSDIIVPHPTNPNIYFLFTVGTKLTSSHFKNLGFNYYTIDMTKNSSLGEIIGGPVDLSGALIPQWSEKVTAVQGYYCNTIWVLSMV